MRIEKPSAALSPFVKNYWSLDSSLPPGGEHIQRIVPSGLPELIFYFGELPVSLDKDRSVPGSAMLGGQQLSFYDLRITAPVSLFSIIFQPQGLKAFFREPVSEFLNQNVPLRFLLRDQVNELENSLFEASSLEERIRITETFLLERLRKRESDHREPDHNLDRISRSIGIINQRQGLVDIDYLARETCLSRKQFERIFLSHVGSSPKQFLRTVRFQRALKERSVRDSMSLTELTYFCGYFDQSHMTHEFSRLAGMTPSRYFSVCEPYSDYFQ